MTLFASGPCVAPVWPLCGLCVAPVWPLSGPCKTHGFLMFGERFLSIGFPRHLAHLFPVGVINAAPRQCSLRDGIRTATCVQDVKRRRLTSKTRAATVSSMEYGQQPARQDVKRRRLTSKTRVASYCSMQCSALATLPLDFCRARDFGQLLAASIWKPLWITAQICGTWFGRVEAESNPEKPNFHRQWKERILHQFYAPCPLRLPQI